MMTMFGWRGACPCDSTTASPLAAIAAKRRCLALISVNVEIATDDELAGVVLHHVRLELLRRQAVVVIQNQQSRFRPLCNLRELLGRRVVLLRETPERSGRSSAGFGPRGKPGARVNFVNQDVTAAAGIDRCLSGIRIARDHDASVRSV